MIHIIDCGTSWLREIQENVDASGYAYQVVNLDQLPNSKFDHCSGVIISGANIILTKIDQQKFLAKFEFIKNANFPILGICLGHQIIGLLHGAKIDRNAMIDKQEKIEIVQPNGLFTGIQNNTLFREEHSKFISLPKDFELLAQSNSCANEAMKHPTKPYFGVQFHPEVSGASGKKLISNFLDLCIQSSKK